MKNILVLFYIVLRFSESHAQLVNDEIAYFEFTYEKNVIKKNKIKRIHIKSLNQDKVIGYRILCFDTAGILKRYKFYDKKNIFEHEYIYITDEKNELIKRINIDKSNTRKDSIIFYKSYKHGKLVSDSSSQNPIRYTYEYDNQSRIVLIKIFSGFGNNKRQVMYSYDSLNNLINISEYLLPNDSDKNGTLLSERDFIYNKDGKISEIKEKVTGIFSWMSNEGSKQYIYNRLGQLIQIKKNKEDYVKFKYNKKGLIFIKSRTLVSESYIAKIKNKFCYEYW